MTSPVPPLLGMRHIALRVRDMAAARAFYEGVLGLKTVWVPDPDNIYLSSGQDNIALHSGRKADPESANRRTGEPATKDEALDHFGFILRTEADVDAWEAKLREAGVTVVHALKDHRDGSRSFYAADPDGNVIQFLYEPTLSGPQSSVQGLKSKI